MAPGIIALLKYHWYPAAGEEVRVTLPPLQKTTAPPGVMVGTAGIGFTVTSTSSVELEQPPRDAVILYLTTSGAFDGLVSVWTIVGPEPELKPVVVVPVSN